MKVDICVDLDMSIADKVTVAEMREWLTLVVSTMWQGHHKGNANHPGVSIAWELTRDEDGTFAPPVGTFTVDQWELGAP